MQRFTALSVLTSLALTPAFSQTVASSVKADVSPAITKAPAVPPSPNTLLDGTAVKLRLSETLNSATAKTGQSVSFEVVEDVVVNGITVLPKGSQALATITDANSKKSMGRGGKLNVNVDSARLLDGEKVQLRAVQDNKGGGHIGAMTGAMVATGIVFFPAAPLFLFIHGKDINIPKGTEVTAFVQGDMKLDMVKFGGVNPPSAPIPVTAATVAATQGDSLTIEANVPNCDIEVDGTFVGNTPSTLSIAPGQHTIVIKKKGYADWTRTMKVAGSGVHLNATLEPIGTPGTVAPASGVVTASAPARAASPVSVPEPVAVVVVPAPQSSPTPTPAAVPAAPVQKTQTAAPKQGSGMKRSQPPLPMKITCVPASSCSVH